MTRAPRTPIGVAPSVAGARIVTGESLEAKLGKTAMLVWLRLCARRDNVTGYTHVTVGGLGRCSWEQHAEEIQPDSVKYSLKKLREAGLVVDHGRRWKSVACGVTRAPRQVFIRTVLGTELIVSGSSTVQYMVPEKTAAWLASAGTWGGKRAGAGRKKALENKQNDALEGKSSLPLTNQVYPSLGEIKFTSRSTLRDPRVSISTDLSLPSGEKEGRELAPIEHIYSSDEQEHVSTMSSVPTPEDAHVVGLGLGTLLPRGGTFPASLARLPPYPGSSLVKPAVVPSAPKLNPDQSWEDWLLLMAKAYEGACAQRWPLELRTKVRKTGAKKGQAYIQRPTGMLGHPRSPKWDSFREKLKDAAEALLSLDLSPFAWASFSAQVWRGMNEHKNGERTGKIAKWPPVDWLWSATRILERGDSPAVHECTEGGTVVYGDTHKLLLSKYTDLQREVGFGVPVDAALDKVLPLSEYERLLQQARIEAEDTQRELNRRARAGEWLW